MKRSIAVFRYVGHSWWEKFSSREFNFAEQFARIIPRSDTFLIWHTVVVSRNHNLNIALKMDNRKQAKCDTNGLAWTAARSEVTIKVIRYALWRRDADTFWLAVNKLAAQAHWIDHLQASSRKVCLTQFFSRHVAHRITVTGTESTYIALASIQDHLFIMHRKASYIYARCQRRGISLQFDAEEKGHVHRIKARVPRRAGH